MHFEKNVYSAVITWCVPYMSVKVNYATVLFKSSFFFVCLLILYLLVSIIKSGILNYRVAIYFSLQLCQCLVICLGALILLNAYIFIIVIYFWLIVIII